MCGVVHTNSSDSELVVAPQEAAIMAPSITLGSEPPKATPPPMETPCHLLQQQGASSNSPSSREIPTIDLAADDSDLQKAIALSLQQPEQTSIAGISAEEQDMSKALEVSLRDTSPRTTGTTVDILNPQDRRRIFATPVGLKNIGNSCWFNVVIQPLFFIPVFRDMIINYPKTLEDEESNAKSLNTRLVPTLRHLFSLLIASEKKYIDPSEAVNLFQGHEMRKNTQQDVCEFVHKLLEKLEEEYKLLLKKQGIEKESSEKESDFENPILKLFYGQSRKEISEENEETKLETFGQYPLTVQKYKDIHESIVASMARVSLEDNKDTVEPTQQDTWFKTLPSVLIFSLSRYEFSKEKQRAEKVHNKFDFPEFLFMDRYMESNKEVVKEKHKKIAKIKQELNSLYNSLEKYQQFGSGEAKYPLADILKYVLEFAENNSKLDEPNPQCPSIMEVDVSECTDVEMSEPKEEYVIKCNEDPIIPKSGSEMQADSNLIKAEEPIQMSPNKKMRVLPPAPRTLNPGELPVLRTCLPRWQKEVELQVDQLKKSIGDLECQLKCMYEEPSLHCIPYKLHAVVVHEGQASGGHYWVYIFDSFKNVWMKFNDIQVSESNWQELLQDSIGGQNNASAYCLMYIDETRYKMLFSSPNQNIENLLTNLPLDLQEYVKHDNAAFMKELQEWDAKQEQQAAGINNDPDLRIVPATAPNSPDILCIDDEETNFLLDIHTMLSQTLTKSFQNEEEFLQEKNKNLWVCNVVNAGLTRLKEFASQRLHDDPYAEPSLLDLGIYLVRNSEPDALLQWYAYDIVIHVTKVKNSKAMNIIRQEALKNLQCMREKYMVSLGPTYQGWKKHYHSLVYCAWYFICGYRKFQVGQVEVALLHLIQALKLHTKLKDTFPEGNSKTLDFKVIGFCHRICLQKVNDKLVDNFLAVDNGEKAIEIAQTVNKLIVPALWYVTNSQNKDDEITGDLVRNRWCQIIGVVPTNKSFLVKQIIEVVMSEGGEGTKIIVRIPFPPPVLSLYKEYKDSATVLMATSDKNDAQTSDL